MHDTIRIMHVNVRFFDAFLIFYPSKIRLFVLCNFPTNGNLPLTPNLYNFTYKNDMWLPSSIEIGIFFWYGSIVLLNFSCKILFVKLVLL